MSNELKYLNDNGFFDVKGFMAYLEEQFPGPMQFPFTRALIESLMNVAALEYNYETGQFCTFLSSNIPEISYEEIARFANELMLQN